MIISKLSGLNNTAFGNVSADVVQYLKDADLAARDSAMLETLFPMEEPDSFGSHYGGQTGLGGFKPSGEGSAYPESDFQDDYGKTVLHDNEWKDSFQVTLQMIEDVKMGKIKDAATAFVDSYYDTMSRYAGDFFTKAISTTQTFEGKTFNIAGADGKALFASDHPSSTGGAAQSNLYDMGFSYENLALAEAALIDQRDANGRKLNIRPNTIILPYATSAASLRAESTQLRKVFEALNADGNPNTADRAGNFHAGRWNIVYWNFFGAPTGMTSGESWFMLADMDYIKKHKPYVFAKRKDLTINSYVDNNTDNNIWKGRSREKIDVTNNFKGILACIPGLGTTIA
jgi:hypothetical protein